jgi:hypothetical protein
MRGFAEAYRLWRGKGRPAVPVSRREADPEPHRLYAVICRVLVTHQLSTHHLGCCAACRELWPCDTVRRAYRLREGF